MRNEVAHRPACAKGGAAGRAGGPGYLRFAMNWRYDFLVATSATYPREEEK
ncbi:hypothetical protein [Nitrosococcus oceani]|uniref:hypothetical protein n=1 Tax=Nitrosococcus oceani TaxID=1229 RepID=UPI0018CD00D7|nr:hypothetical protein [Nitrosococcus oceani]